MCDTRAKFLRFVRRFAHAKHPVDLASFLPLSRVVPKATKVRGLLKAYETKESHAPSTQFLGLLGHTSLLCVSHASLWVFGSFITVGPVCKWIG
jgi:hypothetical protein